MFDRDDNIYGGSGGLFTGMAQTAIWGGALYGGTRLILDKDAFKSALGKMHDMVMPVQPTRLSEYDQKVNSVRTLAADAGKGRLNRQSRRDQLAIKSRSENMPGVKRFKPQSGPLDKGLYHEIGSLSFEQGGWDRIKALNGDIIGHEIKTALVNSGMDLNIEATYWKGTQANIPFKNGKNGVFTMNFADYTSEGHSIIKQGSAPFVAPSFYEEPLINGKPSGHLKISGFNEQILDMLTDEKKMYSLAIDNVDMPKLIQEVARDPYGAVERFASTRHDLSKSMKMLEDARKEKIIKLAMGSISGDPIFIAPTNNLSRESLSSVIRPDRAALLEANRQLPSFSEMRVGRDAYHAGKSNKAVGKNIIASLTNPLNIAPQNITFKRGNGTSREVYGQRLMTELNLAGITPNVSQAQIPERTFNVGGNLYGVPSVESYKSVSPFGYHRQASAHNYTGRDGVTRNTYHGENAWRYKSAYTAPVNGSGKRLGDAISNNSANYRKLGYINFADDEHVMLNAREEVNMQIDAAISVGGHSYDEAIRDQTFKVKTLEGKYVLGADKKPRVWTFEDMYNADAAGHKDLMGLMTGQTQHRIVGLNKGTKLLVTEDARPISGINDPYGIETIGGYKVLKQEAYIGNEEFTYMRSALNAKHAESKYSVAVRTVSTQTKAALAGTSWRGAVDYVAFDTINTGDSLQHLMNSLSSLHGGIENVNKNVVGTFGSKLFKSAIPTLSGKDVIAGKGMHELQQFLHASIMGHVADLQETMGGRVVLEGKLAHKFAGMTNMGVDKNGWFDLTSFMEDGQFILEHQSQSRYTSQLKTSLDLLGTIRNRYENVATQGNMFIDEHHLQGGRDYLTTAWNEIQEAYKASSEGFKGTAPVRLSMINSHLATDARKVAWPLMAALSGMENMALSQGGGAFNTAEIGMRDQFMFVGGKEGILKELLSRNSIDSVRLMKEAELLKSSSGGPTARSITEAQAREYYEYIKSVHGENNKYVKDYLTAFNDKLTPGELRENYKDFFKTHGLSVDEIRKNPEIAQKSFAAYDANPVGKIIRTSDGGFAHFPSAEAMGGVTLLPDGRMTFEGKHGGNVNSWWRMANDTVQNGSLPLMALEGNAAAIQDTAMNIYKNRAAIKVQDATYAVNIYDKNLVNHDAMAKLEKYTAKAVNKERSIIGSIATISRRDAEVFVEDQLNQVLNKKSKAVVADLNKLRGTWIHADHYDYLKAEIGKGFIPTQDNIRGLAKQIIKDKMIHSSNLVSEMKNLNQAFIGGNAGEINKQIKLMAKMVKKTGMAGVVMRNPVIYEGSLSGMYTFIREDTKFSTTVPGRKNKKAYTKVRDIKRSKTVSVGFELALNTHGDWDGDKFQYIPLFNMESRAAVEKAVTGIQRKTAEYMSMTSKRMKGIRNAQTMSLTDKQLVGLTKKIFEQKTATTYAAYVTKAFTGSMNIAALATKGMFEKLIKDKKMTPEQIEDVVAWTRSIPSLFTEQQVISSKHLESLIKGSTQGKTRLEHIMESIGKVSPERMMEVIRDSGGNVHPIIQMSLANLEANPATRGTYARAAKFMDLSFDLQTGYRGVTGEQLDEFKDIFAPHIKKNKVREWEAFKKKLLEQQKGITPLVERESFVAAGFDKARGWSQILAEGTKEQSNNIYSIIKKVEEEMQQVHKYKGIMDAPPQVVLESINRISALHFNFSEQLYGSSLAGGAPTEARQLRWASKVMPHVDRAIDWIREAPTQRLGGMALAGMAAIAASNLLFGDNTPTSINDIPSINGNPLMDARGSTFGQGGQIRSNSNLNSNVGLLSDSSMPHINVISSINSIIGNNGGHAISVRNDNTNPYLDKMSYYS